MQQGDNWFDESLNKVVEKYVPSCICPALSPPAQYSWRGIGVFLCIFSPHLPDARGLGFFIHRRWMWRKILATASLFAHGLSADVVEEDFPWSRRLILIRALHILIRALHIHSPERRYVLSLSASDHTGSTWLSAFNDEGLKLLGGTTADQLNVIWLFSCQSLWGAMLGS